VYRVRFQNTGTAPAQEVIIRDLLDSDLDITTLHILASSHPITQVEIIPDNALIISYEGINLPDSGSNLQGSQGFVIFSIKPKSNLPEGTQITNQAGIYFDFNEVVLTNTTLNTLRDNPEPIANFEAKHSCTNTGLVYDFTYTGGTDDNATFFWDFGTGASPQTSLQQNPTGVLFTTTGTKQVTLTVTRFSCTAIVTKNVEVASNVSGDKVTICHNGHLIVVNQNALQAHLNHGDCIGSCVTQVARLDNTFEEQIEIVNNSETSLFIYPNPANEDLNINYSLPSTIESGTISVYDMFGRKIQTVLIYQKEKSLIINTNPLSAGIYFITLVVNGEVKGKNAESGYFNNRYWTSRFNKRRLGKTRGNHN